MTFNNLLYSSEEGVVRISLNRPDRLNALDMPLLTELAEALDHAENEPSLRVLVVTGEGRGFCAGADLAQGLPAADDIGLVLERHYNPFILRLRALPVPVVAVVNGVAAGAGASIALAADLTLAAHSARFVLAFARIGLLPDAGSTYFLPERIGIARALGLALLGDQVDAVEAERIGLIWRAVPDADLKSAADTLIKRLASAPTAALAATKTALYGASNRALSEQLQHERESQKRLGQSADFAEGVAAFRDKRPAAFIGR
jgi:2-(1,2-epoxy-1,2-dihydrophenyl)acetyl-CoA isomerase